MKVLGIELVVTPLVKDVAILPKPTLWLVTKTGDTGYDRLPRLVWVIPALDYATGDDDSLLG